MDTIIKAIGATLIAVILGLVLSKHGKDFTLLLTITVCTAVAAAAIIHLSPVLDFIQRLEQLGNLDIEIIGILLKCVGISVVSEIAALICSDAGQAAMGKGLQLLGTAVVLCLSVPIFNSLIDLVEDILQAI